MNTDRVKLRASHVMVRSLACGALGIDPVLL